MFNWLWSRSASKGTEISADDRRTAERHACDRKSRERLVASVGHAGWPAVVADLSATGVGLVLGIRQEPGSWLPLRLVNPGREVQCPLQARVVHTTPGKDGYWFSGCEFRTQLDDGEMAALI